ncbi:MAG: dodecin domain-containing protein [archaeon]|nr:dodecin domain-containing protein [archaeon]
MAESVYKFIELVGSSEISWEDATKTIIEKASKTLRDLRIAEVISFDVKIDENKVLMYRTRVKLSFKFQG